MSATFALETDAQGLISWASEGLKALLARSDLEGAAEADLLDGEDLVLLRSLEAAQVDSFQLSYRRKRADGVRIRMEARRLRLRDGGWAAIESSCASEETSHKLNEAEMSSQQSDSSALGSTAEEGPEELGENLGESEAHERSFERIVAEQKLMMKSLASEQFRLLQFAQLTMDVFLSVPSEGPPLLHVSPLVLQILHGAPGNAHQSPAHATRYAQRTLLVDVEATRQAALRTAEDPSAIAFSFKLRAAKGRVCSVTAPLLSPPSPKGGGTASLLLLAGVSNVMESASLLASSGAPLEPDSLLFRATSLQASRVAQQAATAHEHMPLPLSLHLHGGAGNQTPLARPRHTWLLSHTCARALNARHPHTVHPSCAAPCLSRKPCALTL